MGGNLKVWVFNFRGKIFGGNTTVYISSGETNTVYRGSIPKVLYAIVALFLQVATTKNQVSILPDL